MKKLLFEQIEHKSKKRTTKQKLIDKKIDETNNIENNN